MSRAGILQQVSVMMTGDFLHATLLLKEKMNLDEMNLIVPLNCLLLSIPKKEEMKSHGKALHHHPPHPDQ